ncbi:hypothetical protein Golomagni_07970 [Golovinomyces magnicellulatus]|nr:hypothetical protein Golomagni_07970 [Golovinomyces magnicellulatus]
MSTAIKTIVATGLSSGLGLEVTKQLFQGAQPYRVIFGARDVPAATEAYKALDFDRDANPVTILPLNLTNLKQVKTFANEVLKKLGDTKVDYLFVNAGELGSSEKPGTTGTKWCDNMVVNYLSQQYLIHILRPKLEESKSRIVFVSSGAIRNVPDTSVLEEQLLDQGGAGMQATYSNTKFIQLLSAQWWRRQLQGTCDVVAVSPGMIPFTGLFRGSGFTPSMDMPDAKPIDEGARSIIAAFNRSDFPEDTDRIFLTSWGDWWERDIIEKSTDKALQDKWAFSQAEIEKMAGIA